MVTINIQEVEAHLIELVDRAAAGEGFIIARDGKPLVQVAAVSTASGQRLGFLRGEISVPDDFNTMGSKEIAALFGGGE